MTSKVDLSFSEINSHLARAATYIAPNVQEEKKTDNVEKDDKGGEHLIYMKGCGGNVNSGNNYRYWGYRYMIGKCDAASAGIDDANRHKERRAIYKPGKFVSQAYEAKVAALVQQKFGFPGGASPAANFCLRAKSPTEGIAGTKFPYSWQAHHLIPKEIFASKESVFNADEIDMIVALGYNINHGHNIIFLPGAGANEYVPVHGLVQHSGCHNKYTKMVKKKIKTLQKKIEPELKKAKNLKKHEKIENKILKEFREVEDDLWNDLVAASHLQVEEILAKGDESFEMFTHKESWFKLG